MSKSMKLLIDMMNTVDLFVSSHSDDYETMNRILEEFIHEIRTSEAESYFRNQRTMRNEGIAELQNSLSVRLHVLGGKLVKGEAKASYNEADVHFRNAQSFKHEARRKRRIRNINSYAERNHVDRDYVHVDPVGTGYGFGRTGLFEEKKDDKKSLRISFDMRERKPMEAMPAEDKFVFLCETLRKMYEARKEKEEFIGGKDGTIVVPKNQNYDRDYIEFKHDVVKGDLPYLAINCSLVFAKWMIKTTGDVVKWKPIVGTAVHQMVKYKEFARMTKREDAMYAFCSSSFDDFMSEYDGDNETVKFAYDEYGRNFKDVTRSDKRESERDASTFGGKKLRKKRLDHYSEWIEDSACKVVYGGTDNPLYEIVLQGAAEGLLHCNCFLHPERFPDEAGLPALYITYEEMCKVLSFIRNTVKQESKSLKHELLHNLAASSVNGDAEDFNYEAEVYRQMNIEAARSIIGDLDPDSEDEAVKDEIELIKRRTKHPYDSYCLVAHYPSIDSRIINGTDCLIAYDQLIHAKNPRTKMDVFTEREKLLLVLRRKGLSLREIGERFPKNGGEPEDQATVSDEFTRIWVKPPAQAWLKDLGYKGSAFADAVVERYQNRTSKPDPITGKREIHHEARDRMQAIIDADIRHDKEVAESRKENKLTKREIRERKAMRNARVSLT